MADTRHLLQRRQSWYFVLKVPADLRAKFPSPHIQMSLKTRDLSAAQKARWAVLADWTAKFEVLRGHRQWTPLEIEEKAQAAYGEALREYEEHAYDADTLDLVRDAAVDRAEGGKLSELEEAENSARVQAAIGRAAALRGKTYQRPHTFGQRGIDLLTLQPVARAPEKKTGARFAELATRYLDEAQRDPTAKLTEQTKGQYEAVYRLFDQWAKGPMLADITRAQASDFLDVIATLDPLWGRSPATKVRAFSELMTMYGGRGAGLSNRTINRYSVALSLVWKWAKKRGVIDVENPWTDQQRKEPERRKVEKLPFSVDEMGRLLERCPDTRPNRHDTASTLPWLCRIAAFSGMRLNEICSLKIGDLRQDEGIWFFDITDAKTEAGDRRVPVHSVVLRAGLLEFAKHGDDWLFPGLKPGGPDGKRSWYASKRFTEMRRELGVVRVDSDTGKDKVDFHSFRRSAIQALERARVPQSEAAQIVGHEQAGITFGTYNPEGLTMAQRRDVVEEIRYEGLILPSP
jgi:integrase